VTELKWTKAVTPYWFSNW